MGQKASLKQLGLSYGILAKQDAQNKLISSKKRGAKSKDYSPKKNKDKKTVISDINSILDQDDILLKGA